MKLGAADYVTKPWERGELAATVQRILREGAAAPGVLLVSDDPAALIPVQLALESHVRVTTMSVATAFVSDFPALVLVLLAPDHSTGAALSGLPARFPRAAVVWVSDDPSDPQVGGGTLVPLDRLDLALSHVCAALGPHAAPRHPLSQAAMAAVHLMVSHCRDPLTIDEIACRLLRDTDEKMDAVAREVGYSGAANLSRAFKDVTGVRPGEFRRSSA